jgi:predicted CoA-substrate-specific enzyme activase
MVDEGHVLGIDIGSVAVSFVEIDQSGAVHTHGYAPHHGRVRAAVRDLLPEAAARRIRFVAATSSTPETIRRSATVDPTLAGLASARHLHPEARAVLLVGGEKFSLLRLDERGEYVEARSNSSCAAGTGSFLDQQADVLGIGDSAKLAVAAQNARGTPPRIASRCAVFARTDLIHAQQEGFGLAEICDGLCRGLAGTVADTVTDGEPIPGPVVFAGGVSRNASVRAHLERRLGTRLVVDEHGHHYGALGAALRFLSEGEGEEMRLTGVSDLLVEGGTERHYEYEPLEVRRPADRGDRYEYRPRDVEVDIFDRPDRGESRDVFLGIDIGSTSTKAILLDRSGAVLAGFYTRTAGRPLPATQGIFEAILDWARRSDVTLRVRGAGTTGSGRKLVGSVVGADLVVDEITAHARAAYELDPETDTIIEIGGQDAKFTTLRGGMVTSAVMNTVCAAGTGSFIEEQARRLDVPLSSYAGVLAGARAPLASSRCTVFMQRDINHLLSRGYAVGEILATVLHSVRENYLEKVAREGSIGERICFQGATAKNRALVSAFEQRLGKPIRVSRYCHLTGALGVGHLLAESEPATTSFRGLSLCEETIPVRNEVCELCRNHCKIVCATVRGETAAYGFLCGRDYGVERYTPGDSCGFDLAKTRRRIFRSRPAAETRFDVTIGLPASLAMFDELPLWRDFFQSLGVRVVTSEKCEMAVESGKRLARAEFCAPMAAWHGHVDWLLDRADYVFAPVHLEAPPSERGGRRQYCYYSQYAGPLADTLAAAESGARLLRPVISHGPAAFTLRYRLYRLLRPVLGDRLSYAQVARAHAEAVQGIRESRAKLSTILLREIEGEELAVVLLWRPYVCLDPGMNKGIPDILSALGVKAFFQDMVEVREEDVAGIAGLLTELHWKYAAEVLGAAVAVARSPGLYPVLLTSFKCSPDSLTLDFFRRIMDEAGKPYLVLELDEHDSSVGYETRIEAAVRSFTNHRRSPPSPPATTLPVVPEITRDLGGRSLFVPNWDRLSCALIAANLRREGIDAHLLPETDRTIRKSLRQNTGQCIPLHAIVEGFADEVERLGLPPERCALWMIDSKISCNLGMYPAYVKSLLEARGGGFDRAAVYRGEISTIEVSVRAAFNTYFAYLFGGMLRRMACRVRPYETRAGETDEAVEAGLAIFTRAFEGAGSKLEAVREVVVRIAGIETRPRDRPKVAIFGDLYVRDNEVISQGLVRFIERHGGEVITTPYSEYVKMVAPAYFQRWFSEGKLLTVVGKASLLATARALERQYLKEFARVLGPVGAWHPRSSSAELLERFGVTTQHTGETLDNILKLFHILESDPDLRLFVQASPAFCCPSLVTEALADRLKELTGVPVVCVTYDGTAAPRNDAIIPHLERWRRTGPGPSLRRSLPVR